MTRFHISFDVEGGPVKASRVSNELSVLFHNLVAQGVLKNPPSITFPNEQQILIPETRQTNMQWMGSDAQAANHGIVLGKQYTLVITPLKSSYPAAPEDDIQYAFVYPNRNMDELITMIPYSPNDWKQIAYRVVAKESKKTRGFFYDECFGTLAIALKSYKAKEECFEVVRMYEYVDDGWVPVEADRLQELFQLQELLYKRGVTMENDDLEEIEPEKE